MARPVSNLFHVVCISPPTRLPFISDRGAVLDASSIRRIVPDTQAALRGITYSNPSPDSRVTYSEGDVGDGASRVIILTRVYVSRARV